MKWYLVNKYDEIIDKVDMSDVGINGARTYFIGRKQIDEHQNMFPRQYKYLVL